jgi:hypothetical protein
MTTTAIHLSKTAPWNPRVRRTYREWFAQVDGRRFRIEADRLDAPWFIWEVEHDNTISNPETDFVAIAYNLPAARLAIQFRVDGKTEDEIRTAMSKAPRAGTGRNHPRHVAHRRSWKTR